MEVHRFVPGWSFQEGPLPFGHYQGIGLFPHESNCNKADDDRKDVIVTLHEVYLTA
jgi:hypothetical protein